MPESLPELQAIFQELIAEGSQLLDGEGIAQVDRTFLLSVDCRYLRQNYEINIPISAVPSESVLSKMCADFHDRHNSLYGYSDEEKPIQMVNYRVSAIGAVEKPELTEVVSEAENRELPSTKEVRDVLFCHAKEWLPTPIYDRALPGHVLVDRDH